MSDRYTLECYDDQGDLLPHPGTVEVSDPMQALSVLGQRLALDYAYATCYLHRQGHQPIAQWELEIK